MKRVVTSLMLAALVSCAGSSSSSSSSSSGGIPDAGAVSCARGFDASLSCVPPCAEGNDRSVGEFCTPGGGECDDNSALGAAIICSADFSATTHDWFCTKPCVQDSQCGTMGACRGNPGEDGGQKGCIPPSCQ